jgi:iron complex transport system substrate-binding protein
VRKHRKGQLRRWLVGTLVVAWVANIGTALAADEIQVVDQTGRTVRIEQPVERLVSVYGSGTFTVYALGAADPLVMAWYVGVKGIDRASEAMFRLEPRLEEILAFGDPNVEEVVAREAELVLVDGSRHSAFAEQMTDLGVPVIRYLVETPEALIESVLLTGEALGAEASDRAALFVRDYTRVLDAVADALTSLAPEEQVRVLFLGTDPLQVASGDMYQTHLIEGAGGTSVATELTGYWNEVNLEQILLWNPDVIVIPPYGPVQPADLLDDPDWAAVAAVRSGRVHRMPRVIAPMDTPVPESLLGVAWMATLFYPDLVGIDLAQEVESFYSVYYGYTLTDAELAHLTGR